MNKFLLYTLLLSLFTFTLLQPLQQQQPKWRLIELDNNRHVYLSSKQVNNLINRKNPSFFADITDTFHLNQEPPLPFTTILKYPEKPTKQQQVKKLLPKIEKESVLKINETIAHLQSYGNRYCYSDTGVKSAKWIKDQYQKIIDQLPQSRKDQFSVKLYEHKGRWPQPSVIATWKGKSSEETVIIGAHIDSVRRAPGADDNGSGTSSVLETFRILANSDYQPEKTVEFHGYAAEEIGLRGSAEIAADYRRKRRKIYAMQNIDMNGYNKNDKIAIDISRSVSKDLTEFLSKVIKEYATKESFKRSYFGASDNHSWKRAGYQSCMAFENTVNPHWHRSTDTLDKIDVKYIKEWVRIAVGFIIELSS